MKRHLTICPYDPKWQSMYQEIKRALESLLYDLDPIFYHIGSTSVVGMPAKPIIDVMIVVNCIDRLDEYNEKMQKNGYTPRGENGIPGRRYFVKYSPDKVNHLIHLHCYEAHNEHVANELLFREYLSKNELAFNKYLLCKQEACKLFKDSPDEYCKYKSACIEELLTEAKNAKISINKEELC